MSQPVQPTSNAATPGPFRHSRRVEFADTDAAGIAHFSSLLRYCEEAEHAFLRAHGLSVHWACPELGPEAVVSWPRKQVAGQFHAPAKFEEVVEVQVTIQKVSRATLTYSFELYVDSRHVASCSTTAVCCQVKPGQLRAIAIPEVVLQKLPLPAEDQQNV